MVSQPRPLWRRVGYGLACSACLLLGTALAPIAIIGIALCLTVVLIPLGVLLFTVPGLPLFWLMKAHQKKMHKLAQENNGHPPTKPGDEPWNRDDDYLIVLGEVLNDNDN